MRPLQWPNENDEKNQKNPEKGAGDEIAAIHVQIGNSLDRLKIPESFRESPQRRFPLNLLQIFAVGLEESL